MSNQHQSPSTSPLTALTLGGACVALCILVCTLMTSLACQAQTLGPTVSDQAQIWALLAQTPESTQQRVNSSLVSFAFLHVNAAQLSGLVSAESLVTRVHFLMQNIDQIEPPECPEIYDPASSQASIDFQKINRHLFDAFDQSVLFQFRALRKTPAQNSTHASESDLSSTLSSNESTGSTHSNSLAKSTAPLTLLTSSAAELSFPVVEWAENVLPQFTFENVEQARGETLEQKIITVILNHYSSQTLESYLKQAWSLVQNWNQSIEGKSGLLDRLRCDMCYPARLSILQ